MAAGRLFLPGWMPALDNNGVPIPNARAFFYLNNTPDLASIYSDEGLTIPLANPVSANSSGRFPTIWADDAVTYSYSISAPYGPAGIPFTGDGLSVSQGVAIMVADAAAVSAASAAADAAQTAADLAAIQAIEAAGSTAPAIAGKLDRNGLNFTAGFLTNIGAVASAALAASGGAALVGYISTGTGSTLRSLISKVRGWPDVKDYGAVGDGTADDTTAIQNALNAATGGRVYLPQGSYRITSALTIPGDTKLYGAGRALAVLRKQFNGNFATLSDGALIEDVGIDLQGATYSGRGLTIAGGNQTLRNVNLNNGADACVYFPNGTGSRFLGDNVQAFRVGSGPGLGLYAVVYENTLQAAGLTTWRDFKSGGAESFYFGGANNCLIMNSALFDCEWTTNSRDVSIVNCRMAGTVGYTLIGSGSIIGGGVGPDITINAGGVFNVSPAYTNGQIFDNSGGTAVVVQHKIQTYVPVLKGGGVAVTLGTGGSYQGRYSRSGKLVTVNIRVVWGTGATIPAGQLSVTLPTGAVGADLAQYCVQGSITPTSGIAYPVSGSIAANGSEAVLTVLSGGALVVLNNATPSALGDGTGLYLTFSYQT